MLPAPGQAALAVTARSLDSGAIGAARDAVHDTKAALAVTAERSLLASLGGGCEVPVAAFGELLGDGSSLMVWARVVSLDGQRVIEERVIRRADSLSAAEAVGAELAARLVEGGAEEILEALRAPADRGMP
jgi:hydroxymethylbilane synthase